MEGSEVEHAEALGMEALFLKLLRVQYVWSTPVTFQREERRRYRLVMGACRGEVNIA